MSSRKRAGCRSSDRHHARIAQLVEHNLAKVGVASSNLVSRSSKASRFGGLFSLWGKGFRGAETWEVWLVKQRLTSLNVLYQLPLLPVLLPHFRPSAATSNPQPLHESTRLTNFPILGATKKTVLMKYTFYPAILAMAVFVSSCSFTMPLAATSNPIGDKVGRSSIVTWFGVFPVKTDASIQAAAKNGGITKISTVDVEVSYRLLRQKRTTIVTGS